MKRLALIIATLVLVTGTAVQAADYRYVKPEVFRSWIENGKKTIIVDIQVPAQFAKRHIKNSIGTGAYPVKSEEEKKRLDAVLEKIKSSREDVVIVCPRGGGGAKNTYDYLKGKAVEEGRLNMLEKGREGWPYPEMCATGK